MHAHRHQLFPRAVASATFHFLGPLRKARRYHPLTPAREMDIYTAQHLHLDIDILRRPASASYADYYACRLYRALKRRFRPASAIDSAIDRMPDAMRIRIGPELDSGTAPAAIASYIMSLAPSRRCQFLG